MLCVRLITDPFDLAEYSEHHVPALVPFLQEQFATWPDTARIYRDTVAVANDITPATEDQVAELESITEGLFYVVVYPGDPVTAIIAVVGVIALAATILLFLTPKIPSFNQAESANNSIGNRVNKARPGGRIPDIFGRVVAIPELLTVPLVTFEDNLEVEICYMCVGRGAYDISKVQDGSTPLSLIAGAGAEFYGPGTSPNSGVPQLTVGTPITAPLRSVIRVNETNGQKLEPPNANRVSGSGNIRFVAPGVIENSGGIDFTELFGPGDDLVVTNADLGGSAAILNAAAYDVRFYPDKRIEFQSFDPSTLFVAGQQIILTNAAFVGLNSTGGIVYIDVSGTEIIESVSSTQIQLV